ncbi:MAG: hypothetical protein M1840_008591 [Geoglossum simile]|nr:MAG: hypothetical protein M1840_008591 [Geoglossum simile]
MFNSRASHDDLLRIQHQEHDFNKILAEAREEMNRKSEVQGKNKSHRLWKQVKEGLHIFCSAAHRYTAVMDVLVQQHPEWLSLAYGAVKFLLVVSVNHQELKEKFVYHLENIGSQFEAMQIFVRLHPDERMVNAVSGAYAEFLKFLELSVSWCGENPLVRLGKSIASPWETRVQPHIQQLDKHVKDVQLRVKMHDSARISQLHNGFQHFIQTYMSALEYERTEKVEAEKRNIWRRLGHDPYSMVVYPPRSELFKPPDFGIKRELFPELPDINGPPRSLVIRNRKLPEALSFRAIGLQNNAKVKSWIAAEHSSLLWIDGYQNRGPLNWTTSFAIDLLLAGKYSYDYTMLYYFCGCSSSGLADIEPAHPRSIVHSFMLQLLVMHSYRLRRKRPEIFHYMAFELARNSLSKSWFLFTLCLESLRQGTIIYVIVDSIDSMLTSPTVNKAFSDLVGNISQLLDNTSHIVKVLFTSVTSTASEGLFPVGDEVGPEEDLSKFNVVRIPRLLGRNRDPYLPRLRPRTPQPMVRLPDSDPEFGLAHRDTFSSEDSEVPFESSDDEDL